MPGSLNVIAFDSPLASAPVSQLPILPLSNAVAVCGTSPTLTKVRVVPALIRARPGQKAYSTLLSPILTLSIPSAIGPVDPAIVAGTGGGHNGLTCPFREKAHTASP